MNLKSVFLSLSEVSFLQTWAIRCARCLKSRFRTAISTKLELPFARNTSNPASPRHSYSNRIRSSTSNRNSCSYFGSSAFTPSQFSGTNPVSSVTPKWAQ